MAGKVYFFYESEGFKLKKTRTLTHWIKSVAHEHKKQVKLINYIFCDDEYLLNINKQYLNHDTYTDIITFDNSHLPEELEADIFISVERVKDNACQLNVDFYSELHRVMIHGLLHLCGFKDKTFAEKQHMRLLEDQAIELLKTNLLSLKK